VNRCGRGWFEVNVIPETFRVTTARNWKSGVRVNLETDMMAKYARQLLQPYGMRSGSGHSLTEDFLRQHGF
jgi:riboflavin synthase